MIYVADAGAFLNVFSFDFQQDTYYTTGKVLAEIKDNKNRLVLQHGESNGHLIVSEPSADSVEAITKAMAEKAPDLSPNDISILALALDFKNEGKKFELKTDDYQMQNLAFSLGIRFKSVLMKGIKKAIDFYFQCSACGKVFSAQAKDTECVYCGSMVEKKRKFI